MSDSNDNIDLNREQLWLKEAKLSTSGFKPIYQRYYDEIYRFIYRRTGKETLTNELCSETFYQAMSQIHKFNWQGKPIGNWLYVIAANVVRKYYRNKQRTFIVELDRFEEYAQIEEVGKVYNTEDMVWVLEQITEQELMLIELRFFEGKNFKDVALLMNMKESAVKMKLYRLLLRMQNLITKKNGQAGI